ncbi:MAG TPA: TetR family transcriptional regulator [Tichowtungia sp.]|nr:TetR family transcriptional regulator [Tichowtungia sp.]
MARKTKEEAQATRESVLMAALDLFAEKGYSRTTFSDIAKRIGMTRGAVYWHFENKEALLATLIDFANEREKNIVDEQIPRIRTLEDLRNAFVSHARVVENDPVVQTFEFFLAYQMEWTEELLNTTQEKINELRPNPLDDFRSYFDQPEIAKHFKPGTDVDQLVLTLGSFWVGACKLYLGRKFPSVEFGTRTEDEIRILSTMNFERTIVDGFDLIMKSVLKEEVENE